MAYFPSVKFALSETDTSSNKEAGTRSQEQV